MRNDLIYVYCLVSSPPELGAYQGVKTLKSVEADGLYAIVRDVSEDDFSEENFKRHLSDIQWLETNAREHVEVIQLIMEDNEAVPFKFGTIFQAETNLRKFITDYSVSLKENFHFVGGREEWAVKIYCDRKALCLQIDELSEEAATLEKQIMASSPGRAYLLKRKKTDLIENEMDRICKTFGQENFDKFKNLSQSTNLNNLMPKEFTGREDTMILNATFLVSKEKVSDFKALLETLEKKGKNSGFLLEMTGPWPPFSFISLKEK